MEEAGVRADLRAGAARFEPGAGGEAAAAELQELVHKAGIPETLGHAIIDAYNRLGDNLFVAVRSSATAEDTASTSFAGMNETFTNVRGADELLDRVVDCWASLFGARVLHVPRHPGDRGRARDRRRGPTNGRRPPIGRDVHRRPGHRGSHASRDRGFLRARRGRRRRPGRARHVRGRQVRAHRPRDADRRQELPDRARYRRARSQNRRRARTRRASAARRRRGRRPHPVGHPGRGALRSPSGHRVGDLRPR